MMKTLRYQMRFTTPAFLGNAKQSGQWRTPPFKALLRQWWRVVWAAGGGDGFRSDVAAMRRDEGRLFGNAWLEDDFRKSAVRLRLSRWDAGEMASWQGQERPTVFHPEVERTQRRIGPHAYLGYGPLDGRGGTRFAQKGNAAIQAGESADLSIAAPDDHIDEIRAALALMNAYGTVGGRSRNGWGSLAIEPLDDSPTLDSCLKSTRDRQATSDHHRFVRPWRDALKRDWPHAIGKDDTKPLVWQTTRLYDDWNAAMRDLAILKIALRTMFVFPNERSPHPRHPRPLERRWLSYPITNHVTSAWNRNLRLPNSLRFKVRPDQEIPNRLRAVIFHVPCRPPKEFKPDDRALRNVWETTHQLLDEATKRPPGQRRYEMIPDRNRRNELKPHLDTLTLQRIPV